MFILHIRLVQSTSNSHLAAELELSEEFYKDSLLVIMLITDVQHLMYKSFHQLDNDWQ